MTAGQLKTRALERLDEDASAPVYFTAAEVLAAINEGQRVFAYFTLCLEATGAIALSPGTAWYAPLSSLANWVLPLRVSVGGVKVQPATLQDLRAIDEAWESHTGAPTHYAAHGFNLLAFRGSTGTVSATYARMPAALSADSDVPEIPEAFHESLIDYAIPRVRAKQGGQEFGKALPYLGRFFDSVRKCGDLVRARSLAMRYDRLPPEISRADVSKLLKFRPAVKPRAQAVVTE